MVNHDLTMVCYLPDKTVLFTVHLPLDMFSLVNLQMIIPPLMSCVIFLWRTVSLTLQKRLQQITNCLEHNSWRTLMEVVVTVNSRLIISDYYFCFLFLMLGYVIVSIYIYILHACFAQSVLGLLVWMSGSRRVHTLSHHHRSKVHIIEMKTHGDPVDITVEILQQWLQGRGRRPVTWQTLIKCLRDTDLNVLADNMESLLLEHHESKDSHKLPSKEL